MVPKEYRTSWEVYNVLIIQYPHCYNPQNCFSLKLVQVIKYFPSSKDAISSVLSNPGWNQFLFPFSVECHPRSDTVPRTQPTPQMTYPFWRVFLMYMNNRRKLMHSFSSTETREICVGHDSIPPTLAYIQFSGLFVVPGGRCDDCGNSHLNWPHPPIISFHIWCSPAPVFTVSLSISTSVQTTFSFSVPCDIPNVLPGHALNPSVMSCGRFFESLCPRVKSICSLDGLELYHRRSYGWVSSAASRDTLGSRLCAQRLRQLKIHSI